MELYVTGASGVGPQCQTLSLPAYGQTCHTLLPVALPGPQCCLFSLFFFPMFMLNVDGLCLKGCLCFKEIAKKKQK